MTSAEDNSPDMELDEVPVPVVAWREDGTIVAVNAAAAAWLGWSAAELRARSYWEITLAGQKQREIAAARGGAAYAKEFVRADGAPVTGRAVGVATRADGAHVCAFAIESGGPLAPGREALLRRQGWLLLQLAQNDAIDSGDLERALPALTEAATAGIGCERASLWIYDAEQTAIRCLDLFEAGTGAHSRGAVLAAREFPGYFAALAENRTIAAADAHTDPATREFSAVYLAPLGIGAMLDAPIRQRGAVRGVLCCEHVGGPRPFSDDEQDFAATLAEIVARALTAAERRRAEEALAEARAALERHSAELELQVAARTRELERLDGENRQLIAQLRAAVEALSSPVLEVWRGVLAMPVVGSVDAEQGARMTGRLLEALARTRARHVVVDLTGLARCDAATAEAFVRLARAVGLLGAQCVLSGLQPEAARVLAGHATELAGIAVRRDLQHALQEVLARGA